ncbi:tyrosine-type recombinase/integrase [Bifidobacterium amazonense]|uniref:Tyrosine-type recombinase/integrase n=1 Tax=Bifidobacterium amazonense TaxID=2809027 RepID=A0ABS9VWT3_9BIFI|nr:tyrosine-type recombinase/integrase [Bifidobacterium amazonense]MCH9276563.1 tyrosine-type recombinase/integrase [Bifidobacterium amazonense]
MKNKPDGLAGPADCIVRTTSHGRPVYRAVKYYRTLENERRFITGTAPCPDDETDERLVAAAKNQAVIALNRNIQKRLAAPRRQYRGHRLHSAIDGWLAEARTRGVAETSYHAYENEVEHYIRVMEDKRMDEYTTQELQALIDAHPAAGKYLRGIWGYAVRQGWITAAKDPTQYLKVEKHPVIRQAQKTYIADWIHNGAGLLWWLSYQTGEYERYRWYPVFLIEMTMGLRRGEVCGLKWRNVNLSDMHITVKDTVVELGGHRRKQSHGKSAASQRIVPMPARVMTALQSIKDHEGGKPDPESYVFHTRDGEPLRPNTCGVAWTRSQIAYYNYRHPDHPIQTFPHREYDPWHWPQHSNRHIFASILAMENVDYAVCQDLLGHARASITDRYTQSTEAKRREAIEKVDDALLYHGEPDKDATAAKKLAMRKRKPQLPIVQTVEQAITDERQTNVAQYLRRMTAAKAHPTTGHEEQKPHQ